MQSSHTVHHGQPDQPCVHGVNNVVINIELTELCQLKRNRLRRNVGQAFRPAVVDSELWMVKNKLSPSTGSG